MIDKFLIIPIAISFFISFIFLPIWIRKAHKIKLIWIDMNKFSKEKIAGSGGIIVLLGFLIGVLIFVAYRVFYLKNTENLIEILSLLLVVVFASGIGLIDDLMGWRSGGLSRRSRIALLVFAAIPIMAINAGRSIIDLPFLGNIDIGLIYPLIIIPIGIVGATSTFNFLAGYNGLEAGQGILLILSLGLISYITGNSWLFIISMCMIASLLAFLFYNFCPAKVFPGDSLTYAVGSLIVTLAVLGNFEKLAIFFFIPYILETFLKLRGKLVKYSFGKPNKDGTLDLVYDKFYGLEHISIYLLNKTKFKATEKKVILLLWSFQLLVIIIGFIIFREGIFKGVQ